ncbi:unnamed protein product [Haemonchus placei]|uniref:SCP domain-containing protein n=1 Tax=Haemonchus placei TaxID=6290 RepID=A0A158QQR6_HAEPC|nr:unnamed protein product [Haemonchus placei]
MVGRIIDFGMPFSLAVLISIIAFATARSTEKTLPPVALEALMEVSLGYNENLEWSEAMVKEALEALRSPEKANAVLKIKGKEAFSKTDPTPIGIRMIDLFKKLVEGKKEEVAELRKGAQFGCNGVIKERKQNTVVALCLYRN